MAKWKRKEKPEVFHHRSGLFPGHKTVKYPHNIVLEGKFRKWLNLGIGSMFGVDN